MTRRKKRVSPVPSANGDAKPSKRCRSRKEAVQPAVSAVRVVDRDDGRDVTQEFSLALPSITAAAVLEREVEWLSPGRLPLGAVVLLDGTKGSGKSSIAARIAAAVTGGEALPGAKTRAWGDVLWFAGEEDIGQVRRKLAAAGAVLGRVHFPGRLPTGRVLVPLSIQSHEDALEATVRMYGARLIVFDTLTCFVGGADLNQEQPARAVMTPLTRIAESMDCCIFAIRHPRKTPVSSAIDRGMGNPAIAAAARAVLMTGLDPDTRGRVLGVLSCNSGRPGKTLLYDLEDAGGLPVVQWLKEIDLDPERFEVGAGQEAVELVRMDAKRLLRHRIGTSWVPAADVIAEARRNGISQDALDRARWKLGVPNRRVGKLGNDGHWEYGPPEGGWPNGL